MMDDAAYLHTPKWGFLPVAYTGQVSENPGRDFTEFRAMGGGRSVTRRPAAARSWAVSGKVPLDWAQTLLQVRAGTFGYGPFAWVPPLAQRYNALTGGFGDAPATKAAGDSTGALIAVHEVSVKLATARVPVTPGKTVTVSAWAGSGTVSVEFQTEGGAAVATNSVTHPGTGGLQRLSATVTVPGSATKALVAYTPPATAAGITGQPALTWTTGVTGYIPPAGCSSVFVNVGDLGHTNLGRGIRSTLVDVSFDVLEVN